MVMYLYRQLGLCIISLTAPKHIGLLTRIINVVYYCPMGAFKSTNFIFYYKLKHQNIPIFVFIFNIPQGHNLIIITPEHHICRLAIKHDCFRKCIRYEVVDLENKNPTEILNKINTHIFKGFIDYVKKM